MKQQATIDAELAKNMFWMACRYGIGRHSYVQGYAYDMGAMYNILNADERRRAAVDIRQCIGDALHMASFGFTLDWNIPREDRKPYEMFLDFLNTHEGVDLASITSIECYYDDKKGEYAYEISRKESAHWECKVWETDIQDLQPWADLASMLDDSGHVMVEFMGGDGHLHKERCYPTYVNEAKDSVEDDGMMYCTPVAWHYKVVYRPLRYGMTHRCVEPKAITKIERIEEP